MNVNVSSEDVDKNVDKSQSNNNNNNNNSVIHSIHDSVNDPISFEPMHDAMSLPCGHSFAHSTITEWLSTHSTCPLCNAPVTLADARPNFALRAVVDAIHSQQSAVPSPVVPSPAVPSPAVSSPAVSSSSVVASLPMVASVAAAPNAFLDAVQVREINANECEMVASVLAKSFAESDDIFCGYVWPDRSVDTMKWFFGVIADYCVREGRAWAAFAPSGAMIATALWQSPQLPGEAGVSVLSMVKSGLLLSPFIMGIRATARTLKSLGSTERTHLDLMGDKPHWSLYTIASVASFRSRGVGTKLLAPVLADADAAGVPVYVDTATPRTEAFFERSGFVSKRKLCGLKDGVPPFTAMVRAPANN
jgi:GNAT superfamily N-acetyltransferase